MNIQKKTGHWWWTFLVSPVNRNTKRASSLIWLEKRELSERVCNWTSSKRRARVYPNRALCLMELKSNLFCLLSADKGKVCELILSFCALIRGGRSDPHRAGGWGTGRYGKTLKLWYVACKATYHSFKVCSFDRSNMVVYGEKEKKNCRHLLHFSF